MVSGLRAGLLRTGQGFRLCFSGLGFRAKVSVFALRIHVHMVYTMSPKALILHSDPCWPKYRPYYMEYMDPEEYL